MLLTRLNTFPYPKFILIEDSLDERGNDVLHHIIKCRMRLHPRQMFYFVFEGKFSNKRNSVPVNIVMYDFTSDAHGWLDSKKKPDLEQLVTEIRSPCIIIIDSLLHVVHKYGFKEVYRILNNIINGPYVLELTTTLHADLLEDSQVLQYFRHLSTLHLAVQPKFKTDKPRICYTLKKPGSRVIREIEEYYIDNGQFITQPVQKLDPKLLVQASLNEVSPDSLTTFKISLDENEKAAREKLILPYLPKEETEEDGGGKIFYQFDDFDDWDEEDPDDDLDI